MIEAVKRKEDMSSLHHTVVVNALRVHISFADDYYFAQGLEIDYAAVGSTPEEVKENFHNGLIDTIHEHLTLHGTLKNLMKIAPQEAWDEAFQDKEVDVLTTESIHDIFEEEDELALSFPFPRIAYLEQSQVA